MLTPTDETVNVVLMLKMPWMEEKALQAQLSRLVLSVEAQVVNASSSGSSSPPASDTIFTGTVQDVSDPFILVDEEEASGSESEDGEGGAGGSGQFVYAVWKLPVTIGRPRIRLQGPSVVVTASATLGSEPKADLAATREGYLPSGMASGFNLLEAFKGDPGLGGVRPQLSALRVSKVAPLARQQDRTRHIRALPHIRLPVHPVLHTRVRFSRPNALPIGPAVIAILEVDFTPHFDCEVLLDRITLSIPNAAVEPLGADDMPLPVPCVAHDHLTFLYHLSPEPATASGATTPSTSSLRDLEISISATAQLAPGVCTPIMAMQWTASVDFSVPVNPSFSGPSFGQGGSIQRAHRPSQLSIGSMAAAVAGSGPGGAGGGGMVPLKTPAITRPDALPTLEATASARADASLPELGITLSLTAPSEPVRLGDTFTWAVHVVNRVAPLPPGAKHDSAGSDGGPPRHAPRKFAVLAVPRRRRSDSVGRTVRPLSSSSRRRGASMGTGLGVSWDPAEAGVGAPINPDTMDVADAVVDDNILHAVQKNALIQTADLVCLSPDTLVGPVAPGACHVVDLQFLALKEGLVSIEAIRVIDLATQDHVDIRHLPTVMVEAAA